MSRGTILFQAHTSNLLGGGEFSLLAIIRESIKQGYEAHVIVPGKGPFVEAAEDVGARAHVIRSYWWTKNDRNELQPKTHQKAVEETKRLLRELSPVLCVTNTIATPWLGYASYAEGTPHAWILREYGDTDHGLEFWVSKKNICKMVDQLSDKLFANSAVLREHYADLTGRPDIGVINPYVTTPVPDSTSSPFRTNALKLVCVGNLSEGKGQFDAVKATKQLVDMGRSVQLFLLGTAAEVPYQEKIQKYIAKHKLENSVILAGYIKNPANYVAKADINLVCSRTETFGRVTIESLLLDTPVIGTNSANTRELLNHTDELLYTFGKPDELVAKIIALCEKSPTYRRNITKGLRKSVQQRFSPDKVHAEFFDYAESLSMGNLNKKLKHSGYLPLDEILQSQKQIGTPGRALRKIKHTASKPLRKAGVLRSKK